MARSVRWPTMTDGQDQTTPSNADADAGEVRDELPDDLIAAGYVGAYKFPDNSRRRIPALIYLGLAALIAIVAAVASDATIVNDGWYWAVGALAVTGVVSLAAGQRMHVDERDALVAAQQALGFPVGHASAQQVWRGVRSRPTWRVLAYSAEEPPRQRGLVLVDGLDGSVVEALVEDNPDV